ncbi:UNVERIFIED_CONTAM: hypothetical protein K2H54_054774 [Gekko kuhli]
MALWEFTLAPLPAGKLSSEAPTNAQSPVPPPISESSTSALPANPKSTSDRAQPNIVAPPTPELMVLPPIELLDSPIQQLDPPISKASVAIRPKSSVEVVQVIYRRFYRGQGAVLGMVLLTVPDLQGLIDPGPLVVGNIAPGPPGMENVNPFLLDADNIGIGLRTTITPD